MPLLDDILVWSATLPLWQQDALRRLFESGTLIERDFQELLHLLKAAHGVEAATEPGPVPLALHHVPAGTTGVTLRLLGLGNLVNVNGFPDGRALEFATDGMTVVFGENGVGKSGYARVLKNACRARKREAVKPNAFDTNGRHRVPSAEVHFTANGERRVFHWTQGGAVDPDLPAVAVYDAACASDYIEAEGTPGFQPFGLSQVVALAQACRELERRINAEIATLPSDTSPFRGLVGDTAVGRFIAALGPTSDAAECRRLGTLMETDTTRLAELTTTLNELNPEPRALALERLATRLSAVTALATTAQSYTTDRAVDRLRELVQAHVDAEAAQAAAQALLQGQDLLPGTGSAVWRALFQAAREFSTQLAYPAQDHPHLGVGARCVLCQSELNIEAQARMRAFAEFVASTTATAAASASTNLHAARERIAHADFTLGIDATLQAEINDSVPAVQAALVAWRTAWEARRTWMLGAIQSLTWEHRPGLPDGQTVGEAILEAVNRLRADATQLRRSADPQLRARLQSELNELRARQHLVPHVPAVERLIHNSQRANRLRGCLANVSSGPISRQLTTFADTYITQALLDTMLEEMRALGYQRNVRHRVPRRTEHGVPLVRLSLDGTADRTADVLSDGEQRATALAFFFAEMRLMSTTSTLVFDDPVSSMDHRYRRSVAARLAQMANDRQVIVFTHDAVFLMALHHACEKAGCAVAYRTLEWDTAAGLAIEGLSWDHMSSGQRMNDLRQRLSAIAAAWGEYPSEAARRQMSEAYTHLRGTIERIIRQDLLNKVIEPYHDEVNVENFAAVIGMETADWEALLEIYDRACELTRAHDTTSEQQADIPGPEQLRADLAVLDRVIAAATRRRSAANTIRSERGNQRRGNPSSR